jgi:small GTP-binding protein
MGTSFSRFWNQTTQMNVIMVGLDGAGKSSILRKFTMDNVVALPIIGLNIETANYKNVNFNAWDIGGPGRVDPLLRDYFQNANGIIFVIDSNDKYPTYAKDELHKLLHQLSSQDIPLLVYANKQDLPSALSAQAIMEQLELNLLCKRPWKIQSCCAMSDDNLNEGLDWLINEMQKK